MFVRTYKIDLLIDGWDIEVDLQMIVTRYKLIYYLIAGLWNLAGTV
jgi:hypothetical protein